ncbi:MAG: flavin reductase family protein [Candidatus Acidiferrales bacterium]|jgi:flavin reductase (DIM6/NTAB) family NADH-FMN oxidoreductase RutF
MGTESLKGSAPAEGAPPPGPSFDARLFRSALGRFASGVTIITASYEGQTHGMTANAFVSVSLDPPLVLVSLDNRSYMHRILPSAGHYGVSVLAENQERLSNHFAGRTQEGLHIRFIQRENIPLMEGAVAYFAAKVIDVHPAGDHTLYVGRVLHFESRDDKPLVFYSGRYHHVREKIGPATFPQDEFSLFSIGNVDPPIT